MQKAYNGISRIFTTQVLFKKTRNEIAIRQWLKNTAENGKSYLDNEFKYTDKEGNTVTTTWLEAKVAEAIDNNQPERIIADMFCGREAFDTDIEGSLSFNITLKGDLAQDTVITKLYEKAIQNHGIIDFLMGTFGCKFFKASMNVAGRRMN